MSVAIFRKWLEEHGVMFTKGAPYDLFEAAKVNVDELMTSVYKLMQDEHVKTVKAFGGCTRCYGKGYSTVIDYTHGSADFIGDKPSTDQNPIMRFCKCDRGQQLKNLIDNHNEN